MFLCQRVGKIQALLVFCFGFACRQKPNVLECAVGIISLSFTLFTVVVFLALAVTSDCEKTHNLSNKYSKKLVRKMRKLYFYICNTSKEFLAISYRLVVWKTRLQLIIRFGLLRLGTHLTRERLGFCKTVLLRLQNLIFKPLKF